MEKHDCNKRLLSYDVTTEMVESLVYFLRNRVHNVVSPQLANVEFDKKTSITLISPAEAQTFMPLSEYPNRSFRNDLDKLVIELAHVVKHDELEKGIVLVISLSREREDSYLQIALKDESARSKLFGIEKELLLTLENHRNNNNWVYRNEYVATVLFLVAISSACSFYLIKLGLLKSLFAAIFGVSLYLISFRFIRGYCTFECGRQTRLNSIFKWISTGIAGTILTIILAAIRKKIFHID